MAGKFELFADAAGKFRWRPKRIRWLGPLHSEYPMTREKRMPTGLELLGTGFSALRGAGRRARMGIWDYLTARTRVRGEVELERARSRGAVEKMAALPPVA